MTTRNEIHLNGRSVDQYLADEAEQQRVEDAEWAVFLATIARPAALFLLGLVLGALLVAARGPLWALLGG